MAQAHTYRSRLTWAVSTGEGYGSYDRTHRVVVPPADVALTMSADRALLGSPDLANPEQLLLAAVSSCQLLSFLALAARSRIDVVDYTDDAEALMPEHPTPMRITRITLRPNIVVTAGTDGDRVVGLVGLAHDGCFIANTLKADTRIEPVIEVSR